MEVEAVFTLTLHLACSTTGERSEAKLSLKTLPLLGIDLKKEIESEHEIPVFTQTLTHESLSHYSTEIADDDAVGTLLRHGDSLRVTYTSKAECKDVQKAVEALESLVIWFREHIPTVGDNTSTSSRLLYQAYEAGGIIQLLRTVCPSLSY